MSMRLVSTWFVLSLSIMLSGCNLSESKHSDLEDFIKEKKSRPSGKIKEPPKIEPYEPFTYDAYRMRAPFDRPLSAVVQQQVAAASSGLKPDAARQKERLESYDLSSLNMVGTLTKSGALWALISDPDGSIERVRPGNYIGRNHGKITRLTKSKIELLEIVASGQGWLERPNILELQTAEEK